MISYLLTNNYLLKDLDEFKIRYVKNRIKDKLYALNNDDFISPNMFSSGTFWINGVFSATDYLCTKDRGCFVTHDAASATHWVRPKMYIG